MTINDLMIGNWVETPAGTGRVTTIQDNEVIFTDIEEGIDAACDIEKVKPIKITREFLERNGFEKYSNRNDISGSMEKWVLNGMCWVYFFSDGDVEFEVVGYEAGQYRGPIKYVHEVQQAFKICKTEKEFVL